MIQRVAGAKWFLIVDLDAKDRSAEYLAKFLLNLLATFGNQFNRTL